MDTKKFIQLFRKCEDLDFYFESLFGDYIDLDAEVYQLNEKSRDFYKERIEELYHEWTKSKNESEDFLRETLIEPNGKSLDALQKELILFDRSIKQNKYFVRFHCDKIEASNHPTPPKEYFLFKRKYNTYLGGKEGLIQTFRKRQLLTSEKPEIPQGIILKWNKQKIDFVELTKALFESNSFQGVNQKELFTILNSAFDVGLTISDIEKMVKLQELKKRTAGSEIKYLNELSKVLEGWINKDS